MSTKLNEMIELLNKDLSNELKHLRFYLYHASFIKGIHREEYKEYLLNQAKSELEHVNQFSNLIIGLGGVPTTHCNPFDTFENHEMIIQYALDMEKEVVENYAQRLQQAEELKSEDLVNGTYIQIFLENQFQDSREDLDNLVQIRKGFR